MQWTKGGLIYSPTGDLWWARTHAHLPTATVTAGGELRVYFDSLDARRLGRIGYVDLAPTDLTVIVRMTAEPVLDVGEIGSFDDSGVNPACLLDVGGEKFLYYVGWQRAERVPYMLFTGLAVSRDGGQTFSKVSRVPILDRTAEEPFSRSAPCVWAEQGLFKMWYWSCAGWFEDNGVVRYRNVIKFAESSDGIRWPREGHTCIAPTREGEYSVGRPWVIKQAGMYHMWFSARATAPPYHSIGYAESSDGLQWRRSKGSGITASASGWDSEMVCLPCVTDFNGRWVMFYNGNRNGETGFGYAEAQA